MSNKLGNPVQVLSCFHTLLRRTHLLSQLVLLLFATSCTAGETLGPRPAPDLLTVVEAYLQLYQPGVVPRLSQSTRLYDRHGALLAEVYDEGLRRWVALDQVSPHLINATIATEDATFFTNSGVDARRVIAALWQNATEGQVVSGASTITMQLARNLFLGADQRYDQSMDRKILEVGLAQELTDLYSKAELLEMYLNLLNYGHLAYGPEAASQLYFDKSSASLTLAEATLLAGIPQQPANLDPFTDLDAAKARQRVVLDLMVRHGYLTPAGADAAFAQPLTLNPQAGSVPVHAPHFVQYVIDTLDDQLGEGYTRRAGLNIITTLDLRMQEMAQTLIAKQVAQLQPQYDLSNAALVALMPGTAEILVMVGSADFSDPAIAGQVNVAISQRQPGSVIKPLLYATALDEARISPATVLWDTPVTYEQAGAAPYTPLNYDRRYHGPVTARTALANSYNVPAVKLLAEIGVAHLLERARALGLHSLSRDASWYGLSLTVGGGEVTLLDLTTAFHTIANNGRYLPPRFYLAITDNQGRALAQQNAAPQQVLSEAAAFLVTDMLSDNAARAPDFGLDSPLNLSRPAAAKTGTTDDWRDNWTVGFTRYLVTGVWAGNSDGRPMHNASGVTGAAPIWQAFMEAVLAEPAALDAPADAAAWAFIPPPTVVQMAACPPGLICRAEGEYFSQAWLDAMGDMGPLGDSVITCETVAGQVQNFLKLPTSPDFAESSNPSGETATPAFDEQALAWSRTQGLRVAAGGCDEVLN